METDKLMNADNFNLFDLGVDRKGGFDSSGAPCGWTISCNNLADGLPRHLLDQPVILINNTGGVYVRGIFSSALTEERKSAMKGINR